MRAVEYRRLLPCLPSSDLPGFAHVDPEPVCTVAGESAAEMGLLFSSLVSVLVTQVLGNILYPVCSDAAGAGANSTSRTEALCPACCDIIIIFFK